MSPGEREQVRQALTDLGFACTTSTDDGGAERWRHTTSTYTHLAIEWGSSQDEESDE